MFERYNEKARRTIFFARYEASQFGAPEIETEHLLLGLLREGRSALNAILGLQSREDEIRAAIVASSKPHGKKETTVDLPLTNECKRILAYAAEEAMRLDNKHIGIEHLLLGILREEKCLAAKILHDRGVQLKKARALISEAKAELSASGAHTVSEPVPGLAAGPVVNIQIVKASTSETLFKYPSRSRAPRIGEVIRIGYADHSVQSYRIQDVVWEFGPDHGNPGSYQLTEMKVLVVEENTE
jgi:ATP-dependent Clp protease ATP-binding subunit ClpA